VIFLGREKIKKEISRRLQSELPMFARHDSVDISEPAKIACTQGNFARL